ncbi:MAG: hypothetical protein AAF916_09790 [Planctomycetota bacterium]
MVRPFKGRKRWVVRFRTRAAMTNIGKGRWVPAMAFPAYRIVDIDENLDGPTRRRVLSGVWADLGERESHEGMRKNAAIASAQYDRQKASHAT